MKMGIRTRLLTATALVATGILVTRPALAQDAPGAATVPEASKAQEPVTAEEILVTARRERAVAGGLMLVQRQPETTNSITSEAIAQKMAISGPYQLIASLPGVNTGQSDPYQMSIRYGLQLRGLPMNKIGWVVDGMPPMDRAYLLPYSETYADTENLAGLTIHPGSARITDPVQTAVGGEFSMTIRDPNDEAGGQASYSHGSFNGRRYFAGFDTGLIGNTGIKAFATVSETKAGTFALPDNATGSRFHADFKVVKEWGDVAKSSIWVSYVDLH